MRTWRVALCLVAVGALVALIPGLPLVPVMLFSQDVNGVLLAVVEAHCRYHHPARYDDEMVIRTWIEKAASRLVMFGYEMSRATDGRALATGETKHIFCTRDMKPARLPVKYRALFELGGGE